jgi:glucose/arabinose dehydrogenase
MGNLKSFRLCLLTLLILAATPCFLQASTLPANFAEETIGAGWNEAVGIVFSTEGRMFVWERGGRVWNVENGIKATNPFLDISEETGVWNNFGLLGFCLDPNFSANGYVYALYVVDPHYWKYFGTAQYDPKASETKKATFGRLTRFTARAADGFRSVDPASRKILVGQERTNGFPLPSGQHGVGTVMFGSDGTLLASCGDGATASAPDLGSESSTYYQEALNVGILKPKENVGAFRAQLVDCLNGKIIRIDPATGEGIPGNPFYDPSAPAAHRSRVWALGLKTPCRMMLRPGTGSHHRSDANPGVIYIGDVGWNTWEDLNVCNGPGMNFGWPIYEGMDLNPDYGTRNVANLDAPNPLYSSGGCSQPFFFFRDLLKQDTLDTASWPNPCNTSQQVPSSIPRFLHARPVLDYKHGSGPARTPTFFGRTAASVIVGATGSQVKGKSFGGTCVIGGLWYTASDFPSTYRSTYFLGDYDGKWIKNLVFNDNHVLQEIREFATDVGGVVALATDPVNGGLFYVAWPSTVGKLRYVPNGNLPPKAVAALDRSYGPGPLTVTFTGSNSTDPEKLPLAYRWDFGDGSPWSTNANPVHEFNAAAGVPTRYDVTLTVTDRSGNTDSAVLIVSVNNTPPVVRMTSPLDGSFYSMLADTAFACTADVSDAEQDSTQLTCAWQTVLHHNNHIHSEPWETNCATTTIVSPEGCDGQTYFYTVTLVVTDAAGLSSTNEARLYPFCPGVPPSIIWTNPVDIPYGTPIGAVQQNARANMPGVLYYDPPSGTILPPGLQALSVTFVPDDTNTFAPVLTNVWMNVLVAPSTPTNLMATALGSSSIYLSWVDTAANETGFSIESSADGLVFTPLALVSPNTTNATHTGLLPSTTLYYRLFAYNTVGASDYSNTNRATTAAFSGARINFQPASSPVPNGYLPDTGAVYGSRTNGLTFGWNKSNTSNAKDRNSSKSPDERYDTFIITTKSSGGSTWEIAVPNGTYNVFVVAGDPSKSSGTYKYDVEGVLTVDGKASSSKRWVTGTSTVTVTDGRLTVSNASGGKDNVICFIDITLATPVP